MTAVSPKDFLFSLLLHAGFILGIMMLNPFTVRLHPKFESVAVNIISLPPRGNPDLLKGETPKISIPKQTVKEQKAGPLPTPSKTKKQRSSKKAPSKVKNSAGYIDDGKKGSETQAGVDIGEALGPGSKFGSVAIDNANFNYPYYFIQAFDKVQQNWSNPVAANQPLSCIIHFQIIRSGTVLDPSIEQSSGVPAYDRACLRAVQASSPLPPLPVDFRDDIIGIHLEFPYQPR